MNNKSLRLRITFTLVCLALLPQVQALSPAPDGCYPEFTTAEGCNALNSLTTGAGNTGVGWYSLFSANNGSFNTGVGAGTLVLNVADSNTAAGTAALLLNTIGTENTAIGADAMVYNDTGDQNTANGFAALQSNVTGGGNTAIGASALFFNNADGNTAVGSGALLNNTTGGTPGNIAGFDVGPNVAVGQQALESNTIAGANTAVGFQALHRFTTGPMGSEQLGLCTAVGFQALANARGNGAANSGFGYQALMNNTDGFSNTAIGVQALFSNTTGGSNVATGTSALSSNDSGNDNTAIGTNALEHNIDGVSNTAIGSGPLLLNVSGSGNTAIGVAALHDNTGNSNVALGNGALFGNTSGDHNTALGILAGDSVTTAHDVICIGASVSGANVNNSCYIGSIFGQPSSGGTAVLINSDGKLGTTMSSRRFKEEIKPMAQSSEVIFAFNPVTFRYKKELDPQESSQFGLVAEEVERVNPDLVVRDKQGNPYSVRYDQVNAMLLNEFLKEHRAFVEEQHKVAQQQKEIDVLKAELKEQRSLIQKVSDKVELKRSTAQVVADDR